MGAFMSFDELVESGFHDVLDDLAFCPPDAELDCGVTICPNCGDWGDPIDEAFLDDFGTCCWLCKTCDRITNVDWWIYESDLDALHLHRLIKEIG